MGYKTPLTKTKQRLLIAGSLLLTMSSQAARADLINTDFSAGYSGWSGEVISYNYASAEDATVSGDIFSGFDDNFSLSGDQVTLATSQNGMNDYWSVTMFQETMLAATSQSPLLLSLNVSASLTDDLVDLFFVQLRDLATDDVIDLSSGGTFDVSAWAGEMVSLEFGVMDFDFNPADSLTVSDISLVASEVPAPATGLLLALGAFAAARRKVAR